MLTHRAFSCIEMWKPAGLGGPGAPSKPSFGLGGLRVLRGLSCANASFLYLPALCETSASSALCFCFPNSAVTPDRVHRHRNSILIRVPSHHRGICLDRSRSFFGTASGILAL